MKARPINTIQGTIQDVRFMDDRYVEPAATKAANSTTQLNQLCLLASLLTWKHGLKHPIKHGQKLIRHPISNQFTSQTSTRLHLNER